MNKHHFAFLPNIHYTLLHSHNALQLPHLNIEQGVVDYSYCSQCSTFKLYIPSSYGNFITMLLFLIWLALPLISTGNC